MAVLGHCDFDVAVLGDCDFDDVDRLCYVGDVTILWHTGCGNCYNTVVCV